MRARKDITGKKFGQLTVLGLSHLNVHRQSMWLCRCSCGNETTVVRYGLVDGGTQSCGCRLISASRERARIRNERRAERERKDAIERLMDGFKFCSNTECRMENPQPLEDFFSCKRNIDGRTSQCKSCGRDKSLRYRLGITAKEKQKMIDDQGGCCGNSGCRARLTSHRHAHVDHDHATGVIRGVLCSGCNTALGQLKDSPEIISGLLAYATKHRQLVLLKGGKQ